MMYPDKPPNRVTKSVSFGTVESQNDSTESSPEAESKHRFPNDDSEQSSQVVDSNTIGNNEEGEENNDSTLEIPKISKRKLRRRSLLMRMVDEESDFLPPRESMLMSQRIDLGEDFNFSSDEDDDEEQTKEKPGHFTTPDMEQASKPKGTGEFSFKKFKHLPDIVVTPTKEPMENRRYLTEDEIRKLHMSEDDLIKKSLVMSNCMKSILVILLILLFGFSAIGIGYKIGQKE